MTKEITYVVFIDRENEALGNERSFQDFKHDMQRINPKTKVKQGADSKTAIVTITNPKDN